MDNFYDDIFNSPESIFADLELTDTWIANNPDFFKEMSDTLPYQPNSWKGKPVQNWLEDDVLHWMASEVTTNNKNYENVKLQNFTDLTGDKLRDMSKIDFIQRTESCEYGELFFNSKEQLFKQQEHCAIVGSQITQGSEPRLAGAEESASRLSCSSSERPPRKGPGRPRSSNVIRRKPENRTGKLWEFLRNLLLDNKTCPSLIKWDDYNEGTFKFVQSDKVAQLWGNRKKNHKMNYEKLSRAMRYYYRSKVLLPVVGRRLVYKFGPQASGWRTPNPILESRSDI